MLRITAPFFVPRRTTERLPVCDPVYARLPHIGKSAHRVKWAIVTTS
ncbi:hypothetical protein ABZ920_29325 [Streptomyces sp. NPDC046831]